MKWLDHFLQKWRISVAERYIPSDSELLDIGCYEGALFHQLSHKLSGGLGIDPALPNSKKNPPFELIAGSFPQDLNQERRFDVITMLAVFEHIPPKQQKKIASACNHFLRPGGLIIITVPSPYVDPLLDILQFLNLAEGMSAEEHYGFDPEKTTNIFKNVGFITERKYSFQLGLNNLFVFRK